MNMTKVKNRRRLAIESYPQKIRWIYDQLWTKNKYIAPKWIKMIVKKSKEFDEHVKK